MCSRNWSFLKSYVLQLFPQSDCFSFGFSDFLLYESPRFSMMSLFFCDHTQGQPGRKKGDDCSSHSVPGRPAAQLGWNSPHSQLLTAPLLNTREPLPVETLVLFYCRGPLSTFLPTYLFLTPWPWSILGQSPRCLVSSAHLWGSPPCVADPRFSQGALPWGPCWRPGSLPPVGLER